MVNLRRVISNLQPARRYSVRIRALSKFGVTSNWSEALDFVTPADSSVPSAPENLIIDFDTPDLILQWDNVTTNTDGSMITDLGHYRVTLSVPGGGSKDFETTQSFLQYPFVQNKRDFDAPEPQFNVSVRAVDVSGKASLPLTGTATNPSPSIPEDPTGFATFTMMTVSMSPNPVDEDIKEFVVERSEDEFGPFNEVAVSTGDTYIDTGVQSETYYFRYFVRDFFGQESPYSSTLELATQGTPGLDTEPPIAPQDFAVDDTGIDDISGMPFVDLTWTPNVVDDDLSHFELRAIRDSDSFVRSTIIGPGASSYRLNNLDEDTAYTLILYAYDFTGNRSDPSDELSITTPSDDAAPLVPTGTGVVSSFRSLTVFWDPDFNRRFSRYEVYAEQTPGFTADTSSHTNRVYVGNASRFVHPIGDDETWYFRVRTINDNNVPSDLTTEFSGSSPDGIASNKPGQPTGAQFRVDAAGNMWIGDDDFESAPFSVSNIGSALMRNAIITGEDMDPGDRIIDTPAFIVTNEGEVTAESIVATGGTIGGITINETNLTGGEINGSTFNIGSGGINFTGSGNITWDATAVGGIELANNGYLNNSAYRADSTTGWQMSNDGIIINEGTISAQALQIGVSSENLLRNSAFTEGGSTVADDWDSTLGGGADANFDVSDALWAFLGKSQHIDITSSGTWAGVRQDVQRAGGIEFETDETIAASFWIRQSEGTARTAKVFIQTTSGGTLFEGNNVTLTVGAWTRVTAIFRIASLQSALRVSIRINNPQPGDEFYVDGAQLQLSDYVTDFAPRTLEIPTNYIQSANIANLSAGKLTSGQIATAELILTGTGTIRNDPQTWQIDADGAIWENGSITLIAGGDGVDPGYIKMDGSSLRLIAGTTDNDANTKFKADKTGVYIGGHDANTSQVFFDTDTEKTIFTGKSTANVFIINTDPEEEASGVDGVGDVKKVLSLKQGSLDAFYLTDGGEAYFLGGLVGGNAQVDPETLVAGGLTNLFELDGVFVEKVGAGGVFRLDGTGLRFWDNITASGSPVIELDAETGDAIFAGTLSAATGSFSGTITATGGAITGDLNVTGRLTAASDTIWIGNSVADTASTWHGINLDKGSQSTFAVKSGWVRNVSGREFFRINHGGDSYFNYDSDSGLFNLHAFDTSTWDELDISGHVMTSVSGMFATETRIAAGQISVRAAGRPWLGISGSFVNTVDTMVLEAEEAVRTIGSQIWVGTVSNVSNSTHALGCQLHPEGYMAVRRSNPLLYLNRAGSTGQVAIFRLDGSNGVGSISITTNATAFNTSSDYRLKENDTLIENALGKIENLRPITFAWKGDGAIEDGFFAHEVQGIIPYAVHGEKDAVTADGEIDPQQIDNSKLVPLLTASIQELAEAYKDIKNRLDQLEAAQ